MKEGLSILCTSQPFQWLQIFWGVKGSRTMLPCGRWPGRWPWLMNSLLLSSCLWRKDHFTSCNSSTVFSTVFTHPWIQVLPTQRLWVHSIPRSGRFNCRQERHLFIVLLDWIPFSSFSRSTGYFCHDTMLLWKLHCRCLYLSCGQRVWPIHSCTEWVRP